ncbi:hypothetical protein IJS77_03905 [bacterium]|nr:hypothetical protein [bacterium]
MKNKILITLIILMNMANPAFSFTVSNEIKAGAVFFFKISALVVLSAIIIGIGLWLYKIFIFKKNSSKTDSQADKFTCEIDDAKTIGDAIKTFLTINK